MKAKPFLFARNVMPMPGYEVVIYYYDEVGS